MPIFFLTGIGLSKKIYGGEVDSKNLEELRMVKGELEAVKVYSLVRVAIGNPEIADIANAESGQVMVAAKRTGETSLFVWDEYGKRTIIIRVYDEDLHVLKIRVEDLLKKSKIEGVSLNVNDYEGKVVLTGTIPKEKKDDLEAILESIRASVSNLVKATEDLIEIDVQIAELNSTVSRNLWLDWINAISIVEGLSGQGLA